MITTMIYDHAARRHSYELMAQFGLRAAIRRKHCHTVGATCASGRRPSYIAPRKRVLAYWPGFVREVFLGSNVHFDRFGRLQARRLSRRTDRHAEGRPRRDSGNFRRQSSHPRGLRPLRRAGLCVGRAGDFRPLHAEFRERLFAGRNRSRAPVHRQGRHGKDAGRHPGRDRQRAVGRQGRHRRLLPRRLDRVSCRRAGSTGSPAPSATTAA